MAAPPTRRICPGYNNQIFLCIGCEDGLLPGMGGTDSDTPAGGILNTVVRRTGIFPSRQLGGITPPPLTGEYYLSRVNSRPCPVDPCSPYRPQTQHWHFLSLLWLSRRLWPPRPNTGTKAHGHFLRLSAPRGLSADCGHQRGIGVARRSCYTTQDFHWLLAACGGWQRRLLVETTGGGALPFRLELRRRGQRHLLMPSTRSRTLGGGG